MPLSLVIRALRFWSRHLLLLNVALCGLAWLLYGNLRLFGHGETYAAAAASFNLFDYRPVSMTQPGIENVLLPAIAALFRWVWTVIGLRYSDTTFIILAAVPYALFIFGVTRHINRTGGRLLAVIAALTLYTSGLVPYMTSWGGYVDGLGYLLLLPVLVWPESLAVYVAAFVLQCANHYLGAVAQFLLAGVWLSMKALECQRTQGGAFRSWRAGIVSRAVASVAILGACTWFWNAYYPDAAGVRLDIVLQKWRNPGGILLEVLGRFPWTLTSTVRLTLAPIAVLMCMPPGRLRTLALGTPFLVAAALTFVFVDVTRIATMLVMPALLVTLLAAGQRGMLPRRERRILRRLLLATALLNLLLPIYYVNNGDIIVPPSQALALAISTLAGFVR